MTAAAISPAVRCVCVLAWNLLVHRFPVSRVAASVPASDTPEVGNRLCTNWFGPTGWFCSQWRSVRRICAGMLWLISQ